MSEQLLRTAEVGGMHPQMGAPRPRARWRGILVDAAGVISAAPGALTMSQSFPPTPAAEHAEECFPQLHRAALQTLQVNLGYRCNQSCSHCHVAAGPHRRESMDGETLALIPAVLKARGIGCLDLTG